MKGKLWILTAVAVVLVAAVLVLSLIPGIWNFGIRVEAFHRNETVELAREDQLAILEIMEGKSWRSGACECWKDCDLILSGLRNETVRYGVGGGHALESNRRGIAELSEEEAAVLDAILAKYGIYNWYEYEE